MTITGKIQKRLCAGAALAMLAAALLMPAQAAGAPHVTPDTTVAEMRANEGIMGSGVNTWDRGDLLPEQPWMYGHWTLRRFIGPTVEDGVAGLNLIIDNYNQGVQVTYPIYTPEEIAADPSLAEVELYYFPATQPGAKYALVLAGNMFERTSVVKEACGAVSQLHEMGYGAFILRYRIGRDLKDNANYKDLVRAVQFITENAEKFEVQAEDYALVGHSAGGQLCAIFGTDRMGYSNYGLPKPGALLLAYPIINYMYSKPAFFYLYDGAEPGDHLAPGDYYYNIEVAAEVSSDFPPTFQCYGRNDNTLKGIFFPLQSPALDRALEAHGVMHQMLVFDNAPHGSATGTGTDAEGWLYQAAAFWEQAVAARHAGG